jgi:hypothetical protein
MPYYTGLARVARSTGRPVVEVPGWETRGHGPMADCRAIVCHHTAGAKSGNYPSLNVVAYGRAGLAGPLSQFGIGRDGTIYVIAAGQAAHAGKDSQVHPAEARNRYSIGIEAENTGMGEPWGDAIMESYVRLVRALCDEFKLPVSRVYGHKEIAYTASGRLGRKIDPAGFSMDTFRSAVQRGHWSSLTVQHASATTSTSTPAPVKDWFDMATKAELQEIIDGLYDRILEGIQWAEVGYDGATLKKVLHETRAGAQQGYQRIVRVDGGQAALTAAIAQATANGVTPEQITAIAEQAREGAKEGVGEAIRDGLTEDYDLEVTATVKTKEA